MIRRIVRVLNHLRQLGINLSQNPFCEIQENVMYISDINLHVPLKVCLIDFCLLPNDDNDSFGG